MRDEARLLSRLKHENIVEVLAFVSIDNRAAIIMELLEAVDTRVIIDYYREVNERIPMRVALEISAAVASALDAAYNKPPSDGGRPLRVIHRDIKPSNVMVDGKGRVKVLDFGVARAEFDTREAKTAELAFGSLEYMPPERLFFEPESAASDIYSLGTALYEMLALENLGKAKLRQSEQEKFLAERLADMVERYSLKPEFEADLVDVLKAMLAFDETRRPTAAQAYELLRALASEAGPPGVTEWAKVAIPPLVDAAREATLEASSGTLTGQTLPEDLVFDGESVTEVSAGLKPSVMSISLAPPVIQAKPPPQSQRGHGKDNVWVSKDIRTEDLGPELSLELDDDDVPDDTALQETALRETPALELPEERGSETSPIDASLLLDNREPEVLARDLPKPSQASLQDTLLQPQPSAVPTVEDKTVRDDTRWNALKRATLAALNETNEMGPIVVEEARKAQSDSPVAWIDNEDLEGAPTVQMLPDDRDGLSVDQSPVLLAGELPSEADTVLQIVTPAPEKASSRSVPSAPPRVARSTPPPSEPREPEVHASSLGYLISAGMLFATSVLIFLTVLLVSIVGITFMNRQPETLPPIDAPLVEKPAPEVPHGSGPSFVSGMPNTRRMMVRCGEATASGGAEVVVPGTSFAECTITAVDADRRRRTAIVHGVELRAYRCFTGATSTCD